jgi:GxxExxY protein
MTLQSSSHDDWPVLLHEEITKHISNGFLQVFRELGCGFAESIYASALECVLTECGLRVEREVPISVYFHGRRIGSFKSDLIVESAVMVEIKAMRRPDSSFEAQLLNYLRATPIEIGLLLYFNPKPLKRRLIYTNDRKLIP